MTLEISLPHRALTTYERFPWRLAAPNLLLAGCLAWSVAQLPAMAQAVKPDAKPAVRPAANAPAKPGVKPAAKAAELKPIEPVLTRDQLRSCMAQQDSVREQNAEAGRLQADLEREKADLLKDGEALKVDLANLDRTDPAIVEAYNQRASARDERIAAFGPRVDAFNAKVEGLNTERAAYRRDCDNRKFDERDEKALKKQP